MLGRRAGLGLCTHPPRLSLRSLASSPLASTSSKESVAEVVTVVDKKTGGVVRRVGGRVWESVIGLEVHAQINANSKMFSSAPTSFNAPVNSNVSYFDAAIPGTLPALNRRCVEAGVVTSLALGLDINMVSYFDRKHYYYADLPAGYQITQHRRPLAQSGRLAFPVTRLGSQAWETLSSEIVQLQLEQDSGKSLHDPEAGRSLIDLNRCGSGLMEIVFGPDLRHGEEAAGLVRELRLILATLGSCRARMEQGELRVDANISVRRPGEELGVRTEVKNLNSVRSVAQAIEYEVARQVGVLEGGGQVENETRSFDPESRRTVAMRDKEAKQDYRFMPEPNLPPLRLRDSSLETPSSSSSPSSTPTSSSPTSPHVLDIAPLRASLPALPAAVRASLESEHGLAPTIAARLVAWPELLEYYRACVSCSPTSRKEVADLLLILVAEHCHAAGRQVAELAMAPRELAAASDLRQAGAISHSALQEVVAALLTGEAQEARAVVESRQLYLVRDEVVVREFVLEVVAGQAKAVRQWRQAQGKKRSRALQTIVKAANKDPRSERLDMALFMAILEEVLLEGG